MGGAGEWMGVSCPPTSHQSFFFIFLFYVITSFKNFWLGLISRRSTFTTHHNIGPCTILLLLAMSVSNHVYQQCRIYGPLWIRVHYLFCTFTCLSPKPPSEVDRPFCQFDVDCLATSVEPFDVQSLVVMYVLACQPNTRCSLQ